MQAAYTGIFSNKAKEKSFIDQSHCSFNHPIYYQTNSVTTSRISFSQQHHIHLKSLMSASSQTFSLIGLWPAFRLYLSFYLSSTLHFTTINLDWNSGVLGYDMIWRSFREKMVFVMLNTRFSLIGSAISSQQHFSSIFFFSLQSLSFGR